MSSTGNQLLSATFTPTDSADYASAQATVTLVVNAAETASVSIDVGNYELLSRNSGLALGVPAATSGSGSSSLLNGTGLDQETVTGAADQLWSFYN